MQEQGQSQIVLQHQQHQIQQQSQQMQHLNQSMQQQNQQVQQQNQLQQQSQQMQHQLQQQSQQMQQGQSIPQQNPQLQQQSQQIQQQIPSDVAMSAPIGTMSVQVAPQSTITAMPPGSMAIQIPQSISSISQSGLQQQSGTTTITTMSTLQQQQALGTDWAQGRVQVIQQQPLQNATYLQQLYNPQSQLLMPGNLALHSAGVNPGSIQVIAAGKPFQQTGPHILTQGKQVLTAQGQTASFPGYTTIPTTNSQTLVIGQLGVISSQPNILPAQTTNGQSKQDLQKFAASCNRHGTVQQNQSMQFSPWQFGTSLPQNIWTASPQQPTLLATQNPIYIRGATPQDGTQSQQQAQHMFLQSPPPQQLQHHSQGAMSQTSGTVSMSVSQPDITVSTSIAGVIGKPRGLENVQSKGNVVSSPGRPPLLPNSPLRPASSVSTQTLGINQVTQSMQHKSQPKIRAKSVVGRGVGMKSDASNQFKPGVQHVTANRMILTSHGTLVSAGTQQKVLQQQQLQQHQQHQQQQHQSSQQHQQQIMNVHQPINIQQQQQISFQQQQLLQSRPQIMGVSMASVQQQTIPTSQQIQAINSSHQQMVSDRPTLPVLSMEVLQNCQPPISNQLSLPTSVNSLVVPPQMQSISPLPSNQGSTPMQTSLDSHNGKVSESPAEKMELSSVAAKNDVTTDPKIKQGSANETNVQSTNVEPNPTGQNVQGVPGVTVNGEGQAPLDDAKERSSLPKALVKPQLTNVLTHVIEGFVIQEASEPFPVNRSTLMTDSILDANKEKRLKLDLDDYSPSKKADLIGSNDDYSSCEFCGKVELKSKFKKSKRFCSPPCAKRFSASGGKRLDISSKDEDEEKNKGKSAIEIGSSGLESSLSPSKISESIQHMDVDDRVSDNAEVPKVNPLKWSVAEVCNFIKALPGCCEYAEDFANQEIDGQALMLLREDHLMSAMSMKLGPALKIVAKIDLMRETKTDQQGNLEK